LSEKRKVFNLAFCGFFMENKLEVTVDVPTGVIMFNSFGISLSESFRDARIHRAVSSDERALVLMYREQKGEESDDVERDGEQIYQLLVDRVSEEEYLVSPSFPESEKRKGYYLPCLSFVGHIDTG
jgi:hypothetical protein